MKFRTEVIGDATLILGDCREVLPTLPRADAVVTDPPYGIEDAPIQGQGRTGKRVGAVNTWHADSVWDASIDPEWPRLCAQAAPIVAWFGHWRKREEVANAISYPLRAEIVWAKDCHVGPPCPVAMRDERIWLFSEAGLTGHTFETSVWDVPIIPTWSRKEHKNEKPVALMSRLIAFLGAQAILDPFMGSGTTGVAAVNLGKRFCGVELSEDHFDTACRRIEEAWKQPRLFAEPRPKVEQGVLAL